MHKDLTSEIFTINGDLHVTTFFGDVDFMHTMIFGLGFHYHYSKPPPPTPLPTKRRTPLSTIYQHLAF